jgi:hypothetical protein
VPEDLVAVSVWKHELEEHPVVVVVFQQIQGFLAGVGGIDHHVAATQEKAHPACGCYIMLDEQDAHHANLLI